MTAGADADVMPAGELKPLLMLSKRKPVSCAIGLTKDKGGIVLLDRRMKPRKLLAELKSKARTSNVELDTGSLRFGRASVDAASDSSTVHFTVNKAAPGALRAKLLEKLKPAGFQRCDISVDEALESEAEDEEEPGAHAASPAGHDDHNGTGGDAGAGSGHGHGSDGGVGDAGAGAGPPSPSAGATTDTPSSGTTAPEAGGQGAPATADGSADPATGASPAAPDSGSLTQRLSGLVKSAIAAVSSNPGAADAIRKAAAKAKDALTSGDLAGAGQAMDAMQKLLGGPGAVSGPATSGDTPADGTPSAGEGDHAPGATAPPGQTPPSDAATPAASNDQPSGAVPPPGQSGTPTRHQPGSPVFAKGKAAWLAVRTKLQTDIDATLKEIVSYHGQDDEVVKAIRDRTEPVLAQMDDSLSAKLDEVIKAPDGAAHTKSVSEAAAIIKRYLAFVAGDATLKKLDQNPFHPLTLSKTLDTALGVLTKVLQGGDPAPQTGTRQGTQDQAA